MLAHGDGTTWILAGSVVLACYPSGDAGLRNVAVAVCRQLGFGGLPGNGRIFPASLNVAQYQPDEFTGSLLTREMSAHPDRFRTPSEMRGMVRLRFARVT